MPPLFTEAQPLWAHRPSAVFIQRSETTQGGLQPEFARILAAINPLNNLLSELDSFLTIENYNGFELRLDQRARDKARRYLVRANLVVLPMPELTPDGEGGIDIEWENEGRHLALNFSANGNGDFVSWREPDARYEGAPVTEALLIEKLDWLMS